MKTVLTYHTPVTDWVEGLPLGNGTQGLMLFGTPGNENFLLNHDRLWQHSHHKDFTTASRLNEIRDAVKVQDAAGAHALFQSTVLGEDQACNAYQPLAELTLRWAGAAVEDYTRSLDLEHGVLTVGYTLDSVPVAYTAFCDSTGGLSRIRLRTESPQDVTLGFARCADPDCTYETAREGDTFFFRGVLPGDVRFGAAVQILTNGTFDGAREVTLRGATETELRIAMGVTLDGSDSDGILKTALAQTVPAFETALTAHSEHFAARFNDCRLDLHHGDTRTAEEIFRAAQSESVPPVAWYEMAADMARYVLLCSSRPGTLPCNLQGIWNREREPEWHGGFTTDMNLQMYYWCANATGLFECQQALFDWIGENTDRMATLAEEIFGATDAAYIPQYTDCFMEPTCWRDYGTFQVLWGGAAAWLARNFYEYFLYTEDEAFLRHTALPFMRRCANFYVHLLSEGPDGRLHNYLSASPESFAADGAQVLDTATMDIALIRELFGNMAAAEARLGETTPQSEVYADTLRRLVDYPVDETGTLREWCDPREPGDPGHRHLSHIYPLYPGTECFGDPRLKAAVERAVERRLAHNVGQSAEWSYAWYACCFARLRRPADAQECMENLLIGATLSNLFSVYSEFADRRDLSRQYALGNRRIFQADGMLGYYAAVAESLLQCIGNRLVILPGLIPAWAAGGGMYGLRAYGGLRVDITWEQGRLSTVTLFPQRDAEVVLETAVPPQQNLPRTEGGYALSLTADQPVTLTF